MSKPDPLNRGTLVRLDREARQEVIAELVRKGANPADAVIQAGQLAADRVAERLPPSQRALYSEYRVCMARFARAVMGCEPALVEDSIRRLVPEWNGDVNNLEKLKASLSAYCNLPRGEVGDVLGTSGRHARRGVSALTDRGVLTSESPRSPLHITFPAKLASRWMPGLFPERTV